MKSNHSFIRPLLHPPFTITITIVCLMLLAVSCSDEGSTSPSTTVDITKIQPDSGRVGTMVQIYSNGIAPQLNDNSVYFNNTPAEVIQSDRQKLTTRVPEGATSGPVRLEGEGYTADGPYFTIVNGSPSIESVTPQSGGPGTKITITGENFLTTSMMKQVSINADTSDISKTDSLTNKGVNSSSPEMIKSRSVIQTLPVSVQFGEIQAPLLSISSTKIVVEVPERAIHSNITVTVGHATARSEAFHLFPLPVITEAIPKVGPVGTSVSINGRYFSSRPDSNKVYFNGSPAEISQADSMELIAIVPPDATNGPIEIETNGQSVEGPTFTVTEAPVPQVQISDVSPKSGPVGTAVTVAGQNFDEDPAGNTVTFNGTEATVNTASKTKLEVTVPQGATNGSVKVEANGQTVQGPTFTVTADPDQQLTIDTISPKEGPVGTSVTITGANFSATPGDNDVTFNGSQASLSSASTTELVATVPQGATTGTITVEVGSQQATGPTFSVTDAPVPQVQISDVSPKSGPVGTAVTIAGQNFDEDPAGNTVTFNGTEAAVNTASDTKLEVTVPQGATNGPVKVQANGQSVEGPTFTITADPDEQLSIENIRPKKGPVGTAVLITGTNFSSNTGENIVTFNGTQTTVSNASTTQLQVEVPADATTGPVTVKVGSQTATGPTFTVGKNAAPTITGEGTFEIQENSGEVAKITASDSDGDPLTFSLGRGGDEDKFSITAKNGVLSFNTAPDFENPTDADGNNRYQAEIKVTDGSASVTKTLTVIVKDIDEAPVFSGSMSITTDENQNSAGAVNATDPEGQPITYNITGGADQKAITIDKANGVMTFASSPNYEAPADANSDRTYEVEITVSDGTNSINKAVTISVQNVNETPVITSGISFEIEENSASAGTVTATDPDGDDLKFVLLGGTKGTLTFSIDASSGEITISPAPDFENPRDDNGDNTYEMDINVNDGALSTNEQVSITVSNVVEEPTINRGVIRTTRTESYSLNETNDEHVYRSRRHRSKYDT